MRAENQTLIETWEAESLEEVMTMGRTRPIVLNCERLNADGDVIRQRPFVVKCMGLPEVIVSSLFREIVGNYIAQALGVLVPRAVLVNLEDDICSDLNRKLKPYNGNVLPGIGVGSEYLPQLAAFDPNASRSQMEFEDALAIYATDLIIQNCDRRPINPNCMGLGGRYVAFDFESSLGFLYDLAVIQPWELSKVVCEHKH
jgi:hypothetical protein